MNDLLLSLVVIAAVATFGALISVGNERQRRAIDSLHQAYKQWAVQDLRLKRGAVSSQIQITDLPAWLTKVTSLAFGYKTDVLEYQLHHDPIPTVVFNDGVSTIVCTMLSPTALLPMLRKKSSVLRGELRSNPLFRVDRKTPAVELSVLNSGIMFDIELCVAWENITSQITESNTLWAYRLN